MGTCFQSVLCTTEVIGMALGSVSLIGLGVSLLIMAFRERAAKRAKELSPGEVDGLFGA